MSVKTVEAWEAGTNKPIGAARRFLSVLKADPNLLVNIGEISGQLAFGQQICVEDFTFLFQVA